MFRSSSRMAAAWADDKDGLDGVLRCGVNLKSSFFLELLGLTGVPYDWLPPPRRPGSPPAAGWRPASRRLDAGAPRRGVATAMPPSADSVVVAVIELKLTTIAIVPVDRPFYEALIL